MPSAAIKLEIDALFYLTAQSLKRTMSFWKKLKNTSKDQLSFHQIKADRAKCPRGRVRRNAHIKQCGKDFNWETCGGTFKSKQALVGHKNSKHEDFKCEICGKCFESASKFKRHRKTHDKSKSFECEKCGRKFSRQDNVAQHMNNVHKFIN